MKKLHEPFNNETTIHHQWPIKELFIVVILVSVIIGLRNAPTSTRSSYTSGHYTFIRYSSPQYQKTSTNITILFLILLLIALCLVFFSKFGMKINNKPMFLCNRKGFYYKRFFHTKKEFYPWKTIQAIKFTKRSFRGTRYFLRIYLTKDRCIEIPESELPMNIEKIMEIFSTYHSHVGEEEAY